MNKTKLAELLIHGVLVALLLVLLALNVDIWVLATHGYGVYLIASSVTLLTLGECTLVWALLFRKKPRKERQEQWRELDDLVYRRSQLGGRPR